MLKLVLLIAIQVSVEIECSVIEPQPEINVLTTPGKCIFSNNIVFIKPNGTLRMICNLKTANNNIGNIDIKKINLSVNGTDVLTRQIAVNETAIELIIPVPAERRINIDCKYNNYKSERITVFVVDRPRNLSEFRCISYGWKSLLCKLYVKQKSFGIRRNITFRTNTREDVCLLQIGSRFCTIPPHIYQPLELFYNFTIVQTNVFEEVTTEHLVIDNYRTVIPNPISELNVKMVTNDSATIYWKPPQFENQAHPHGLVYKVIWFSPLDLNTLVMSGKKITNETHFEIKHLLNASEIYRVDVTSRITTSLNKLWSPNKHVDFNTLPLEYVPETDVGAFFIDEMNHVTIYWKPLEQTNMIYWVAVGDKKEMKYSSEMFSSSVGKLDGSHVIDVSIYAETEVGRSKTPGRLRISYNRVGPPRKITCRANTLSSLTIYNLEWAAPNSGPNQPITSYTVFWCLPKSEKRKECESDFGFTRVNRTSFKTSSFEGLDFAVSANTKESSSGMVWTSFRSFTEISEGIDKVDVTGVDYSLVKFEPDYNPDICSLTGFCITICPLPCLNTEKITRWITNPNQRSYYFTTEDGVWPGKLYEIGVAGVMGNSIKNKTGLSRFKILGENRLEARSILTPIAIAAVTIALMYLLIVIAFQKIKTMARIQVTMPKGLDVNEAVGENVHTPRLTLEPTLDEPNPDGVADADPETRTFSANDNLIRTDAMTAQCPLNRVPMEEIELDVIMEHDESTASDGDDLNSSCSANSEHIERIFSENGYLQQ